MSSRHCKWMNQARNFKSNLQKKFTKWIKKDLRNLLENKKNLFINRVSKISGKELSKISGKGPCKISVKEPRKISGLGPRKISVKGPRKIGALSRKYHVGALRSQSLTIITIQNLINIFRHRICSKFLRYIPLPIYRCSGPPSGPASCKWPKSPASSLPTSQRWLHCRICSAEDIRYPAACCAGSSLCPDSPRQCSGSVPRRGWPWPAPSSRLGCSPQWAASH